MNLVVFDCYSCYVGIWYTRRTYNVNYQMLNWMCFLFIFFFCRNKCSLNASSEGLLFPRHLTKDMNFPIYRKAFCRTLPLTYNSTSDMPIGYPTVYLYKFLPDVFNSSLDDNKCYCPKDGCLPPGLSDISPCYYSKWKYRIDIIALSF